MGVVRVKIVALIIISIGVISIFDARDLSKKFFSNSDINTSAVILRIVGFAISMIGAGIIYNIK